MTMGRRFALGGLAFMLAALVVGAAALAMSSRGSADGTLRVRVSLGVACSQPYSPHRLCQRMAQSPLHAVVYEPERDTNQLLVANRHGLITANLRPGTYWIAFAYEGAGTITTRGRRTFVIRSGQTTDIPPISPDRYAIQVGAEVSSQ